MTRRYPGPKSLALLAEIHWRAGDPASAAGTIAEGAAGVRLVDWRWKIGETFGAVFARRPASEGLEAFSALAALVKNPFALRSLGHAAQRAGNEELAFAIHSELRSPSLGQLAITVDAYGALRRWKGKTAALDWIRTQVPPPALQPLALFAFASDEDDLLWELVPDPSGEGPKQDFTWLMRAASFRRSGGKHAIHGAILRQHYQGPGATYYHEVGRYLLGLTDEKKVLELVRDNKRQCEIAFYLGLRAQSEGRYEEASDWYHAAFETGSTSDGEFRWANDVLQKWKSSGLSIAKLQQRPR
jgi:hypothetical protein